MKEATVLAVRFERPRDFDLAAHWSQSTEALRESRRQYIATLAMGDEGVAALREWVGLRPVGESGIRVPRGWKTYAVEFDSVYSARFVALGLGTRVRVVGPEALKREIEVEVIRMAAGP